MIGHDRLNNKFLSKYSKKNFNFIDIYFVEQRIHRV